jgi:hypothetical protein
MCICMYHALVGEVDGVSDPHAHRSTGLSSPGRTWTSIEAEGAVVVNQVLPFSSEPLL